MVILTSRWSLNNDDIGDPSGSSPSEEAYRAAAVVFFTRHEDGSVDKVLVALEETRSRWLSQNRDDLGKVSLFILFGCFF